MSGRNHAGGPGPRRLVWLGLVGVAAAWAWTSSPPRREGLPAPAAPGPRTGGGDEEPRSASRRTPGDRHHADTAPGDEHPGGNDLASGIRGYSVGLGLAVLLTVLSFAMPGNGLVWGPAIPAALIVFAIAQMGVHLVFFLHITTGPDNINNVMALAFGLVIVLLLLGGSLWIMAHLDANMAGMGAGHAMPSMQP